MIPRGMDASQIYREEFEFSKQAFKAGDIAEDERAFYSFRPMTADERAKYDNSLIKYVQKGRGRKAKQTTESLISEANLDALCRHLTGLENYGVKGPDSQVKALEWNGDASAQDKRRVLSCVLSVDRNEIVEKILGEADLDEDDETNLD